MNLNEKDIFKQRFHSKIVFILIIISLYVISSIISGFQNGTTFSSIPAGIFWLLQKFIPTQNALQYFPEIINSALKTVLLAITSTIISAIFASFSNHRFKFNWNQYFYKNYNKSNRFIF